MLIDFEGEFQIIGAIDFGTGTGGEGEPPAEPPEVWEAHGNRRRRVRALLVLQRRSN